MIAGHACARGRSLVTNDEIELLRISQGALSFARSNPGDVLDVPWLTAHTLAQLVAGVSLPKVTLPSVEFPVLQLKQVPSVENPAKADYQALVALRMKTLAAHSAGRARGNPMIRIGSRFRFLWPAISARRLPRSSNTRSGWSRISRQRRAKSSQKRARPERPELDSGVDDRSLGSGALPTGLRRVKFDRLAFLEIAGAFIAPARCCTSKRRHRRTADG